MNHIITHQSIDPQTIPGHQALEDSKMAEPKKTLPQIKKTIKIIQMDNISWGGSGSSTISPLRRGSAISRASCIQEK